MDDLDLPLCLPIGNQKVGKVFTFSLPSIITCPGATAWCRRRCYSRRYEQLRPNCRQAYARNLALSLNPNRFVEKVLASLPLYAGLVRIHVGGDFYSPEYISLWQQISQARPRVRFWSYTRSWMIPVLRRKLEDLRSLPNAQVFASCDAGMPLPPSDWRTAFLANDPRASGIQCPEQQGEVNSCTSCGYCFDREKGNVIFKIH